MYLPNTFCCLHYLFFNKRQSPVEYPRPIERLVWTSVHPKDSQSAIYGNYFC